jgi:hypothetical protein
MSEPVVSGTSAPAATNPAASTPAASPAPQPKDPATGRFEGKKSSKTSRADFVSSLNAKLGIGKPAAGAAAPAATPAAEPAEAAEPPAAEEKPEEAEETSAEPAAEAPKLQAHKLAAAQLEAQRAKSDALKAKELAKTHETRVKELETQLESLKDLKSYLKHTGIDAAGLAQQLLDKQADLTDVTKAVERDPEVQALIDEGKKAKEEAARKATQAQAEALRVENVKLVRGAIDAPGFADAFPLVAAMPDAAATMLTWIEAGIEATGKEPAFEDVAKLVQENVLKETIAYLKHPGARSTLLKDPDLAKLLKVVEEAAPAAASAQTAKTKPAAAPAAEPVVETVAEPTPARKRSESPLDAEARKRAKTLTKAISSVPSRTSKTGSSAELAARLNRDLMGK